MPATAFFENLRPRSEVALRYALDARHRPGVGGCLMIHIPEKPGDPVEIHFSTHPIVSTRTK